MCIAPSSIGSLDKSESDVNNSPDVVSDKMNAHQNTPEKTASPTAFLFWMLALLVSTSCQSGRDSASSSGHMFVSNDTSRGGTPIPRNEFRLGEVPQVVILGFGGKSIMLELWRQDAGLVARANFSIPEQRTTREDRGIVFADNFGSMRPVRQIQTTTTRPGLAVQLKPPQPGNYEVRLMVDGQLRQSAPFRVADR